MTRNWTIGLVVSVLILSVAVWRQQTLIANNFKISAKNFEIIEGMHKRIQRLERKVP